MEYLITLKVLKIYRIIRIIYLGWHEAGAISQMEDVKRSRMSLYLDILYCFKKFYIFSTQYKANRMWALSEVERKETGMTIGAGNKKKDNWKIDYYSNRSFLSKYTNRKYDTTPWLKKIRLKAYTKRYNLGENCVIQFNVEFSREHMLDGTLKVGKDVLFAKNVYIDYSGDVTIHDGVRISNGVVIESHSHSIKMIHAPAIPGHLVIEEGVKILSRAFIAETCHRIGRHARIGAESYVRNNVPPYAIVIGNPAKIVGFVYNPEEMAAFEHDMYDESNRTQVDSYKSIYNRYYKENVNNVSNIVKIKA